MTEIAIEAVLRENREPVFSYHRTNFIQFQPLTVSNSDISPLFVYLFFETFTPKGTGRFSFIHPRPKERNFVLTGVPLVALNYLQPTRQAFPFVRFSLLTARNLGRERKNGEGGKGEERKEALAGNPRILQNAFAHKRSSDWCGWK